MKISSGKASDFELAKTKNDLEDGRIKSKDVSNALHDSPRIKNKKKKKRNMTKWFVLVTVYSFTFFYMFYFWIESLIRLLRSKSSFGGTKKMRVD